MRRILFMVILSFTVLNVFSQDWELEKNKEGIIVYTRKMPDSKLKEYKGYMTMNTTMDKLLAFFKDYTKHDKVFYKTKPGTVKMLKKVNENDFYTYMVIDVPLVSNRDVVTHYKISPPDAKGAVTIDLTGVPDMTPEVKGIVRVPKMKGFWKFEPAGAGKIKVTTQAYSSPGGSVPDGMANSASVDAPFSMLEKLAAFLK